MNAHYLGTYKGTKYYRFHVLVEINIGAHPGATDLTMQFTKDYFVIAANAADARYEIREMIAHRVPAPTDITTWGPKGGASHSHIGWESMIGAQMFATRPKEEQLCLFS